VNSLLPNREGGLQKRNGRQIDVAGNEGRFIVSPGRPFTPGTSLDRVRLFCEAPRLV